MASLRLKMEIENPIYLKYHQVTDNFYKSFHVVIKGNMTEAGIEPWSFGVQCKCFKHFKLNTSKTKISIRIKKPRFPRSYRILRFPSFRKHSSFIFFIFISSRPQAELFHTIFFKTFIIAKRRRRLYTWCSSSVASRLQESMMLAHNARMRREFSLLHFLLKSKALAYMTYRGLFRSRR